MTQKYNYSGDGVLQKQTRIDSAGTHEVYSGLLQSSPVFKTYTPGPLSIGTNAARWHYDSLGRLDSIPGLITAQTYEPDGQTTSITYANGVTTTFTYSPTRRWVLRITTKDVNGNATIIDDQYTRDLAGRITAISGITPSDDWTDTYDHLDRLTTATNISANPEYVVAPSPLLVLRPRQVIVPLASIASITDFSTACTTTVH